MKLLLFLFLSTLSVAMSDMEGLILNGKKVSDTNDDYRFIASLQNRNRHFCGGSLVEHSLVLTAGHCVKYSKPDTVRIGSYSVKSGGVVRKVKRVIKHPKYTSLNNDYALLLLSEPVYNIRPINLPTQGVDVKQNTPIVSIGWGYTSEGSGEVTEDLMEVDLVTLTNKECNKRYGGTISSSMLCTWGKWDNKNNQRADACSGDSGSPNFYYDKDGRIVNAGVTSWGRGCGRKNYPGVTARVSEVSDWIRSYFDMSTIPIEGGGNDDK